MEFETDVQVVSAFLSESLLGVDLVGFRYSIGSVRLELWAGDLSLVLSFDSGESLELGGDASPADDPWTVSFSRFDVPLGTCSCDGQGVYVQRSLLSELS